MYKLKISYKNVVIFLIVILCFLQRVIVGKIPQFSYYDECLMVIFLCGFLGIILKKHTIYKFDLKILCLIAALIIVGLVGNARSGYSRSIGTILSGILVWFKAFIAYISVDGILENSNISTKSTIKILNVVAKLFVIISFLCLLISPITKYGVELLSARARYGLHPFMFIYSQPALLSWYCLAAMMILTISNADEEERCDNLKYRIILTIVWVSTLRSRAFVFCLIYWLLYYVFFVFDKKKIPKIKVRYIVIVGICTLVVANSAIQKYFYSGETTRSILLTTGILIAIRFFPFGAGLANYATSASFKDYSPLYYDYGFNMIYRLNKSTDGMTELTDCYWPAVMGEFGVVGIILMSLLLICIGKRLLKKSKFNKWIYYNTLFFIVTSLFSSVATAVFSSDAMILYIIIVCLGVHSYKAN